MRLNSFSIDRFGVFTDQRVADLPPGMTVVYGSNEAGKSTCLNFFRAMFFGFNRFRGQNDYYLAGTGANGLAGGSLGLLTRHGELTLVRRPGRKKDGEARLLGPDGQEIAGIGLSDLLGGCTPEAYESVFAFSLGELVNLVDKKDDRIQYALHGAAFGSVRSPAEVIRKLSAQAKAMHTPGGKVTTARELLSGLEQLQEQRRQIGLETEEYARLRARLEEVETLHELARQEHARLDARHRRLERLLHAWPVWEGYLLARAGWETRPDVQGDCGSEAAAKVARLGQQLEDREKTMRQAALRRERLSRETEDSRPDHGLLALGPQIRDLREIGGQLSREAGNQPLLAQKRSQLEEAVAETRQVLGSAWDRERLSGFSVTLDLEEECLRLGAALETAQERERLAVAAFADAENHRDEAERALEESRKALEAAADGSDADEALTRLLAAARQAMDALPSRLAAADRAASELTESTRRLASHLARCRELSGQQDDAGNPWAGGGTCPAAICVEDTMPVSGPAGSDSDNAQDADPLPDLARLDTGNAEGTDSVLDAARRFFAARQDLLDSAALPQARRKRDQAREWEYTATAASMRVEEAADSLNRLEEQAPPPGNRVRLAAYCCLLGAGLCFPAATVFRFLHPSRPLEFLSLGMGGLALAACAILAALALGRSRERRSHAIFLRNAVAALARAESERDAVLANLAAMDCGPGRQQGEGPAAYWARMADLTEAAVTAGQAMETARAAQKRHAELSGECRELYGYVRICAQAASGHPPLSGILNAAECDPVRLATQLGELERRLDRMRQERQARLRLEQSLAERTENLEAARRRLEQAKAGLAQSRLDLEGAKTEWCDWLRRNSLATGLSPATGRHALDRIRQGREACRDLQGVEAEMDKHCQAIAAYCSRVAELPTLPCGNEEPSTQLTKVVARIKLLADSLEREREKQVRHVSLTGELAEAEDAVAALAAEIADLRASLAQVLAGAGVADPDAFAARHEQWRKRQQAEEAWLLATRQAELAAEFLEGGLAEMGEEFRDAGQEEFADRTRQAAEEANAAATRLRDLAEELGRVKAGLDSLSGQSRILALRAKEENLLEELQELGREWSRLTLAVALLGKAKEVYEQRRQPEVVRRAGELFAAITEGAYRGLTVSLDNQFRAVTASGEARDPERELSRGTREQLYLALRLAYIESYGRDDGAEKLPVIMDDILVNFDRERACRTAQALAQVAKTNQILFFTCHEATADMLADCVPDALRLRVEGGSIRPEPGARPSLAAAASE